MSKRYREWNESIRDFHDENDEEVFISDFINGYSHIYIKKNNNKASRLCDNTEVNLSNLIEKERSFIDKVSDDKICDDCLSKF